MAPVAGTELPRKIRGLLERKQVPTQLGVSIE